MPRPLFVAATRQHTGKSTVSLALISGLQKRLNRVGYMKPVGQQYVDVECPSSTRPNGTVSVDKDVVLMRDFFGLRHLQWEDMSPVLIPRGYTKAYIRGAVAHEDQVRRISGAFGRVSASSDLVVCEGTGHTGVGSVVGLSNAEVASQLGADVVLVANGGIGSAFDELNLNRVMCLHHGVRVRGVVLNKVLPDKVEMVREYFTALVEGRWGVPLLGVVPDMPFLSHSTLGDVEKLLRGNLIAGHALRPSHFSLSDLKLVTTGLRRFIRKLNADDSRRASMWVTHCTRDDVVLGYLSDFQQRLATGGGAAAGGAMVLASRGTPDSMTGAGEGGDRAPLAELVRMVRSCDAPVMLTPLSALEVCERVRGHTAKLNAGDAERVGTAISHYEPHIDFDRLLASDGSG